MFDFDDDSDDTFMQIINQDSELDEKENISLNFQDDFPSKGTDQISNALEMKKVEDKHQ